MERSWEVIGREFKPTVARGIIASAADTGKRLVHRAEQLQVRLKCSAGATPEEAHNHLDG